MKNEISRNPSFTPSPALRTHLNASQTGVTQTINELFDNYQMVLELDAIRLTPDEQFALKEHLQGVFMDRIAVQSVSQDVIETDCLSLIDKLSNATFGQTLATLHRYKMI